MKRKRYTEEQIIAVLMEHEAGAKVEDLARRHGVCENTIYRWKSKFGGLEVSEASRLRELEQQNARLKRLLAEAELARPRSRSSSREAGDGRAAAPGRGAPQAPPCQRTTCLPVDRLQPIRRLVSTQGA